MKLHRGASLRLQQSFFAFLFFFPIFVSADWCKIFDEANTERQIEVRNLWADRWRVSVGEKTVADTFSSQEPFQFIGAFTFFPLNESTLRVDFWGAPQISQDLAKTTEIVDVLLARFPSTTRFEIWYGAATSDFVFDQDGSHFVEMDYEQAARETTIYQALATRGFGLVHADRNLRLNSNQYGSRRFAVERRP